MTKLTKTDVAKFDALAAALKEKQAAVSAAQDAYNEAVASAWVPVAAALEAYNEAIADARDFAEATGGDLRSEYDERSEKWQESDKGSSLSSMADEWEDVALDELEAEQPDPLELLEDDTRPEDFEALPLESDE